MAERTWETSKVCYCEHVMREVALEAEVLYPMDFLPDPPRVLSHRCSHGPAQAGGGQDAAHRARQ